MLTLGIFLIFGSLSFGLSSCQKEVVRTDTLVIRDTIYKEPVIPVIDTLQVLTSRQWKIDEIRFLQADSPYYYKRGGIGNAVNLDNEFIKFNSDYTGIYFTDGNTYIFTWGFKSGNKTKIEYLVQFPTPLLVNWENLIYNDNYLRYSEYYHKNDFNSLATVLRIPN